MICSISVLVTGKISLAIEAGKANPSPPIGPALGAKAKNIISKVENESSLGSQHYGLL